LDEKAQILTIIFKGQSSQKDKMWDMCMGQQHNSLNLWNNKNDNFA